MPFLKPPPPPPPAPEGPHVAVLVDPIDLGVVKSTFQGQTRDRHVIKLVFESSRRNPEGKRYWLHRNYTYSLHKKAKLAELLKEWLGFTQEQIEAGIEFDDLRGKVAIVEIKHAKGDEGRMYANVVAIRKPEQTILGADGSVAEVRQLACAPSGEYKRPEYWAPKNAQATVAADDEAGLAGAESIPF